MFREARAEIEKKGIATRGRFGLREMMGLVHGAFVAHLRLLSGSYSWAVFPTRRFTMHSEFRFPKATAFLMTVILAGTVLAIEKATAIRASVRDINPPHVGPIQPAHFTFVPTIVLMLAGAYAVGLIGWASLFALKRSGVHRLSGMQGSD